MAALADHRGRQWQFCALQRKNLKLELSDFLHITDWQLVEGGLHRDFHKKRVQGLGGARELLEREDCALVAWYRFSRTSH